MNNKLRKGLSVSQTLLTMGAFVFFPYPFPHSGAPPVPYGAIRVIHGVTWAWHFHKLYFILNFWICEQNMSHFRYNEWVNPRVGAALLLSVLQLWFPALFTREFPFVEIKNKDGAVDMCCQQETVSCFLGGGGRTVFYSGFLFYYFGVKMPFYEMMIIIYSSWCWDFCFGFNGLIWQNNPLAVLSP